MPLQLQLVEGGEFIMGAPITQKGAYDANPFVAGVSELWFGVFPVTQAHWAAVMGDLPQLCSPSDRNHPITEISWLDSVAFCEQLQREWPVCIPETFECTLPTECQWEFALEPDSWRTKNCVLRDLGLGQSKNGLIPVNASAPTSRGFYGMVDSVCEWCKDQYQSAYPTKPTLNWVGQNFESPELKSSRGASSHPKSAATARGYDLDDAIGPFGGFRICFSRVGLKTRRFSIKRSPNLQLKSPYIEKIRWGHIKTDVLKGRDLKLYPGGGREWDWTETNTHHVPGIQPSDVAELIEKGCEVIVMTRGMHKKLQVCDETIELLRERGIDGYFSETRQAVDIYNALAIQGKRVGGLFHSTC